MYRSLLSENFLPLGKWFVQPDASVTTDGRCVLIELDIGGLGVGNNYISWLGLALKLKWLGKGSMVGRYN